MRTVALAVVCVVGFVSPVAGAGPSGDGVAVVGSRAPAPTTSPSTPTTPSQPDGSLPGTTARVPAAVGGGYRNWWPPYYVTIGPNGPVVIAPSPPVVYIIAPQPMAGDAGPLGGPMPAPVVKRVAPVARARRSDAAKRDQYLTVGDRNFRGGNMKRARDHYLLAARSDPDSAVPRIRLAQVAIARDEYAEAARRIRESIAAEPDWLPQANGVQAIYAEPGDFDAAVGRLESRVLVEPGDRDAWLALGLQYYLAGKTRRAADVFLRLSDRKPDATLAAFLDATRAVK